MSSYNEVFIENNYDTDYSQEFRQKGSASYIDNNITEAYECFTKALLCNDPSLQYVNYINRSVCYFDLHQYDASLNDAKSALGINPNSAKAYERMAMALLAMTKWDECKEVINKGLEIEPKNKELLSLLNKANKKTEIVTEKRTPVYEFFENMENKSPLFEAIFTRDLEKTKTLIDKYQCDPYNVVSDEKDDVIMNALHVAAVSGNDDPSIDHDDSLEKYLLDLNVDITVKDNNNMTPINLACFANRPTTLKAYIQYIKSKNENDKDCVINALKSPSAALLTMLEVASKENNYSIAKLLLEYGIKPSPFAVKEAAKHGNTSILAMLLEYDVDVNETEGINDEDNLTSLESAIVELHHDCVELLLKHGAKFDVSSKQIPYGPIEIAARIGDKRLFELLLQYKPKIPSGLLQTVIKMKRAYIVQLLKDYNNETNPNEELEDSLTKDIDELCSSIKDLEIEPVKQCNCCKKIFDLCNVKVSRCSRCKKVYYCSRDCQVKDWKEGHKVECSA